MVSFFSSLEEDYSSFPWLQAKELEHLLNNTAILDKGYASANRLILQKLFHMLINW